MSSTTYICTLDKIPSLNIVQIFYLQLSMHLPPAPQQRKTTQRLVTAQFLTWFLGPQHFINRKWATEAVQSPLRKSFSVLIFLWPGAKRIQIDIPRKNQWQPYRLIKNLIPLPEQRVLAIPVQWNIYIYCGLENLCRLFLLFLFSNWEFLLSLCYFPSISKYWFYYN